MPWEKKGTALKRLSLDKNKRIVDGDGDFQVVKDSCRWACHGWRCPHGQREQLQVVLHGCSAGRGGNPGGHSRHRQPRIHQALSDRRDYRRTRKIPGNPYPARWLPHDSHKKSPPPNGTVPFEDTSEESAPDEVCLASYLASQLTANEAGNSHKSQHVPFDLDLLSVPRSPGSSYASDPVPFSSALIHSLCRMTC